MIQPYGVDVPADLGGSVVIAAAFLWVRGKFGLRRAFQTVDVMLVISALGSVEVASLAFAHADWWVFTYHLPWIALGVAALGDWRDRRARPVNHRGLHELDNGRPAPDFCGCRFPYRHPNLVRRDRLGRPL